MKKDIFIFRASGLCFTGKCSEGYDCKCSMSDGITRFDDTPINPHRGCACFYEHGTANNGGLKGVRE